MNRYYWILGAFAALVALLAVGLNLNPRDVPSPLVGKPAPVFTLPQLAEPDKTLSPKDMQGKVWLLNVWSTWCVSCRQEHPMLVQMAISRGREYEADKGGAEISGDPQALASALQKIEAYAKRIHNPTAERNPASGQLFIINPLAGRGADNLFSTHPATGNRVRALMELGARMGLRPRPVVEAAPVAPAAAPSSVAAPTATTTTGVPITAPPRGPWG